MVYALDYNRWIRPLLLSVVCVLLLPSLACQRKCQQPNPTRFQSLRETPWRLVETNNPAEQYRNLSRFTFLIMEFTVDFKGNIKKVVNNAQFDTPILVFQYNVRPEDKYLVIRYSRLTGGGEEGGEGAEEEVGTVAYNYELTNELILYERGRPYFYRYIPFQGVVDPDSTCTF